MARRGSAAAKPVHSQLDALAEPLLRRIDEERHAGQLTTAQERLATLTLRRLLDGAMLSLGVPNEASHLLVATPAGERRELEALLIAAAAAVEGWRVTYLGPDLSADEIAGAAVGSGAQAVCVSVSHPARRGSLMDQLRRLRAALPAHVPLVGGVRVHRLAGELEGGGNPRDRGPRPSACRVAERRPRRACAALPSRTRWPASLAPSHSSHSSPPVWDQRAAPYAPEKAVRKTP